MVEQEPILLLMVCPSIDDQGFRRGERKIAARLVEHNILREHRQFEGRGGCDKDGDGCRLCKCDERNDIELVVVFCLRKYHTLAHPHLSVCECEPCIVLQRSIDGIRPPRSPSEPYRDCKRPLWINLRNALTDTRFQAGNPRFKARCCEFHVYWKGERVFNTQCVVESCL